jgi:predicted CxxxxCH...CXXCH cytochrome family protein
MSPTVRPAVLVAVLSAACACGIAREPPDSQLPCEDFGRQVAPVLLARCRECHGGATPAGGYSVESRLQVLARRDDGSARLQPGDGASDFLRAARGELPGHVALPAGEVALLQDWAVRCRAAPRELQLHPQGWTTPTDLEEFHGAALRRTGYPLDGCRECHGADLGGGASQVSCQSCHPQGPLACNTCHGDMASAAPPRDLSGARLTSRVSVGAHRSHPGACTSCHQVPSTAEAEGHYRRGGALDVGPAEVVLRSAPGLTAVWDRQAATCAGSACHAASPGDTLATLQVPRWTLVGQGQAACGTCHGLPPSSHGNAGTACVRCHESTTHLNGVVEVGDGRGTGCAACHGDETSPAPPRDVAGQTDESLASVGAHRAHLEARHRLRGPIGCTECHQVPASPLAPGHIDSPAPAEVFPAVAAEGTLARTDGASPTYDPGTASCGSVYCHGAGARAARDTAPTKIASPVWTGGTSQAVCGACHGIPPRDGLHAAGLALTACVSCHAASVTPSGAIRVVTDPVTGQISSTHIDGQPTLGGP